MIDSHAFSSLELIVVDAAHPLRHQVEDYVFQRYSLAFQANIEQFMPVFLVLSECGTLKSVCGIRDASQAPLFLEQYLDGPVERVMMQQFSQTISRNQIIEFGQLASFSNGFSPLHFYLMTEKLVQMGYHWCLCTVTGPLYSLMKRLGLNPVMVSEAMAERIPDAEKWGNYYESLPRVVGGNLIDAYLQLSGVVALSDGTDNVRRKRL